MLPSEYDKILTALSSAAQVLTANQGELSAADIRIRCLLNIAAKESRRARLETNRCGAPAPFPVTQSEPALLSEPPSQ